MQESQSTPSSLGTTSKPLSPPPPLSPALFDELFRTAYSIEVSSDGIVELLDVKLSGEKYWIAEIELSKHLIHLFKDNLDRNPTFTYSYSISIQQINNDNGNEENTSEETCTEDHEEHPSHPSVKSTYRDTIERATTE
jgi:hypothetical protein